MKKKKPATSNKDQSAITTDRSISPIDWFADPKDNEELNTERIDNTEGIDNTELEQDENLEATIASEFLPPIEQQRIEEENKQKEQEEIKAQAAVAERTVSAQEDEPSFLPEFFSGKDVNSLRSPSAFGKPSEKEADEQEPAQSHPRASIDAIWNGETSNPDSRN